MKNALTEIQNLSEELDKREATYKAELQTWKGKIQEEQDKIAAARDRVTGLDAGKIDEIMNIENEITATERRIELMRIKLNQLEGSDILGQEEFHSIVDRVHKLTDAANADLDTYLDSVYSELYKRTEGTAEIIKQANETLVRMIRKNNPFFSGDVTVYQPKKNGWKTIDADTGKEVEQQPHTVKKMPCRVLAGASATARADRALSGLSAEFRRRNEDYFCNYCTIIPGTPPSG